MECEWAVSHAESSWAISGTYKLAELATDPDLPDTGGRRRTRDYGNITIPLYFTHKVEPNMDPVSKQNYVLRGKKGNHIRPGGTVGKIWVATIGMPVTSQ